MESIVDSNLDLKAAEYRHKARWVANNGIYGNCIMVAISIWLRWVKWPWKMACQNLSRTIIIVNGNYGIISNCDWLDNIYLIIPRNDWNKLRAECCVMLGNVLCIYSKCASNKFDTFNDKLHVVCLWLNRGTWDSIVVGKWKTISIRSIKCVQSAVKMFFKKFN